MIVIVIVPTILAYNYVSIEKTERFYFESYDADYYLTQEGDKSILRVKETLTAVFPFFDQNKGICRIIPITNLGGLNRTIDHINSSNISVQRNGEAENIYSITYDESGYYEVCTGTEEYVHNKQSYTFEYSYHNIVTDFGNYQELYWDTNGNGWQQKFNSVTVRLHFGDEKTKEGWSNQNWCYVGVYGSTNQDRCNVTTINDGVQFSAKNLNKYENLTFDTQFEPGTFKASMLAGMVETETEINEQNTDDSSGQFEIDTENIDESSDVSKVVQKDSEPFNIEMLICHIMHIAAILLLYWMIMFFFRRVNGGKLNIYEHTFVKPEYQPHPNYPLSVMSAIYVGKKKYDPKIAILLDLAVKKRIEIQKVERPQREAVWKIVVKNLEGISPEGLCVLDILHDGAPTYEGDEIYPSVTKGNNVTAELNKNYNEYVRTLSKGYGLLNKKDQTFYPSGTLTTTLCVVWMVCFVIFAIFSAFIIKTMNIWNILLWLVDFGVFVWAMKKIIFVIEFTTTTEPYTILGIKASRYMDGLKMYIQMTEAERLTILQGTYGVQLNDTKIAQLDAELLPYAALFGCEKSWVKEFGRVFEAIPKDLEYLFADSHDAFYTAGPRAERKLFHHGRGRDAGSSSDYNFGSSSGSSSSSSSGGGGGGFSGGGGGGGGGHGR